VDAGPHGTQSGGHGHADALSVCLQSNGHGLLIDPGTFEYIGPDRDRNLFRGTSMHNTLRVNGENQSEPAGPFSWQRLTKSKVEQWIQGNGFDLLVASHDGYESLEPPATHRRWVFSLRNGFYLVRDVVTGEGNRRLDVAWHLGKDLQLVEDSLYRVKGASQGLALLTSLGRGWAEEVRRESWSPSYGQKAPMTTLNFTANAALPAEFATLLITLEEVHLGTKSWTIIDAAPDSSAVGYKYVAEGVECAFIFAERGNPWQMGSISSDAEFVCFHRKPGGSDQHLILCGGSYALVTGEAELRCARPVAWAELNMKAGDRGIFSSDLTAIEENSERGHQSNPVSNTSE
jgi:hypothetical protein